MSGIDAEQVRLVAVLRIHIGPVVVPLLQVPVASDLVWTQLAYGLFGSIGKFCVGKQAGGLGGIGKALADHRKVCRGSVECGAANTAVSDELVLR